MSSFCLLILSDKDSKDDRVQVKERRKQEAETDAGERRGGERIEVQNRVAVLRGGQEPRLSVSEQVTL